MPGMPAHCIRHQTAEKLNGAGAPLNSPLQSAMFAQSEKLQLARLAGRIAGMSEDEILDCALANPALFTEWVLELTDRFEQAEKEARQMRFAVDKLRSAATPSHAGSRGQSGHYSARKASFG